MVALLTGWTYQRDVAAEHASAERLTRRRLAGAVRQGSAYGGALWRLCLQAAWPADAVRQRHRIRTRASRPGSRRTSRTSSSFVPRRIARRSRGLARLTAAATLQFLVPVLIILLAFTKFAGEREDGTLRQLAATGVSARVLAAGKALGVSAALAMVLVPAALVGATALVLASGPAAISQSLLRIVVLAAVYGLYFSVWIALALAVSAMRAPVQPCTRRAPGASGCSMR